ncbi:MAG: hypothetical protein GX657_11650, partial [Chloroflexi bacterium]|nr:hypothetical protein [Chloroflexota bacterium]
LDTWGQEAAEAWLTGWTQADFGALRDFAGEVQGALRALAGMGEMDEGDVTAAVLGSREAFAVLLQQIRETGSASAEAFRRIREAAGPAGEQAEELARRYARVAEASGRLAEVQGRLREIAGEQQDRLDTGRLAELEAILADPRATAGQRERALAEQERIRLLMEERDLQAELDTAQGELDAYRSRLEVETATRDLLREEAELVKGIVDKIKEASGGGGDGLGDELAEAAERAGAVVDAAEELQGYDLSELLKPLQEVIDEMTLGFEEGELAAQNLGDTLAGIQLPAWWATLFGAGGGGKARSQTNSPIVEQLSALNGHVDQMNELMGTATGHLQPIVRLVGGLAVALGPVLPAMSGLAWITVPKLNEALGILQGWLALAELALIGMTAPLLGPLGLIASLAGVKLELGGVIDEFGEVAKEGFLNGVREAWRLLTDPVGWFIDKVKEAIDNYRILRDLMSGGTGDGGKVGSTTQGNAQRNALGTGYFPGGLSWVGERGPELVSLPRGSRIWPAQQSMAMAGGGAGGGGLNVNVGPVYIRNEEDMDALVWKIVREIKRRER